MSDFKIGDRVRVKGSLDGWPTMVVTGVTEFNGRWYIALVYVTKDGRIKTLDFEESCLELAPVDHPQKVAPIVSCGLTE